MRSGGRPSRAPSCVHPEARDLTVPSPWTTVLDDVCPSHTAVQVRLRWAWGRWSRVREFGLVRRGVCPLLLGSGLGRRVCSPYWAPGLTSGSLGTAILGHGCPAMGWAGADYPVSRGSVPGCHGCRLCREAGGCCPPARGLAVLETGVRSRAERRPAFPSSRLPPSGGTGSDCPEPLGYDPRRCVC